MKEPILFNRLGSAGQVGSSVVGIGGVPQGTISYPAGKFGNGSYNSTTGSAIDFTPSPLTTTLDEFAVEFWFKPYWASTNGVPNPSYQYEFFHHWIGGTNQIALYTNPSNLIFQNNPGTGMVTLAMTTGATWAANTMHHMAAFYSRAGIAGGANTFEVYLDGNLIGNTTTIPGANVGGSAVFTIMNISQSPWTVPVGLMDNLKIWDNTSLSTRTSILNGAEDERNGLNDLAVVL